MTDAYGRDWNLNENDLDKLVKSHKLELIIEYRTVNETSPNGSNVKFYLEVKDEYGQVVIDFNAFHSLNDDDILLIVKSWLREQKINNLLK